MSCERIFFFFKFFLQDLQLLHRFAQFCKSPLVILSSNINCFGIDIVAAITEDVMIDCVGLVSHHFHVKEAFMPPLQWRNALLKNAISTTESYLAKQI